MALSAECGELPDVVAEAEGGDRLGVRRPSAAQQLPGPLELEVFQLRPVEHPELLMVVQVPATPHDRDRVAAFLARRDAGGGLSPPRPGGRAGWSPPDAAP
jgi:hypothetical protein